MQATPVEQEKERLERKVGQMVYEERELVALLV